MILEWEFKGKKFRIDTKKTFHDNVPTLSEMVIAYGNEVTADAVDMIVKLCELLEERGEISATAKEIVEVNINPFWLIWMPPRGISLPFICTTMLNEKEALEYLESYKKHFIPMQSGTRLVLFKVIKAIEFR